ncbi:MAG: hypothetical protein N2C14_02075 [Planctomycetales bacterium]
MNLAEIRPGISGYSTVPHPWIDAAEKRKFSERKIGESRGIRSGCAEFSDCSGDPGGFNKRPANPRGTPLVFLAAAEDHSPRPG